VARCHVSNGIHLASGLRPAVMEGGFETHRYVYMVGTAQPHYPPTWREDYRQTMLRPVEHGALADDVASGNKIIPVYLDHPVLRAFEKPPVETQIGQVLELWGDPRLGVMVVIRLDLNHPRVKWLMNDIKQNKALYGLSFGTDFLEDEAGTE